LNPRDLLDALAAMREHFVYESGHHGVLWLDLDRLLVAARLWTERNRMNVLPTVVSAEYRGEFRIRLAFSDGVVGTIDFSDWLDGPVFEPLKDPAYFARFFIDGGTVAWPNGADIAPETLHDRARASEAA
jgi:hypothetical protein